MKKIKIEILKLANAIKVTNEENLLRDREYEIELDLSNNLIEVISKKTKAVAYTSIYNMIYCNPKKEAPKAPTTKKA